MLCLFQGRELAGVLPTRQTRLQPVVRNCDISPQLASEIVEDFVGTSSNPIQPIPLCLKSRTLLLFSYHHQLTWLEILAGSNYKLNFCLSTRSSTQTLTD
jgi:hypothetical protein